MNTSSISLKAILSLFAVAVLSLVMSGCHTWGHGHHGHGGYGGHRGGHHGGHHDSGHHGGHRRH